MSAIWKRRITMLLYVVAAVVIVVGSWKKWFSADNAGVLAAVASLIAAGASWAAADRAGDVAGRVAAIEEDRWRVDFVPEIEFTLNKSGSGTRKAGLQVEFNGPALHEEVQVRLSILDDGRYRKPGTHGLTKEQIGAQIWGPYKFEPGIDDASADGRGVPEFTLQLGQQRSFFLIETEPPACYPGAQGSWHADYADLPVRVRIQCTASGQKWAYIKSVKPDGSSA
ncbi:hypothetical protein ACIBBE_43335 [Streptomyces sp. NPDC051644]|uniref:hypothetical protein n=1 Tax=Streptomyces sp. NPDC051644 TaxID=3365666 RepID=UPI0037B10D78